LLTQSGALLRSQQPHDAIDFTDNDIQVLGNFPLSPRITTLLLARNRVASIQPTLASAVPNLRNLVLASNNLVELADVDALGGLGRLTHLVLADNPVTKKEVRVFDSAAVYRAFLELSLAVALLWRLEIE
jgi:Leucine-rich repeat (LRR) protein